MTAVIAWHVSQFAPPPIDEKWLHNISAALHGRWTLEQQQHKLLLGVFAIIGQQISCENKSPDGDCSTVLHTTTMTPRPASFRSLQEQHHVTEDDLVFGRRLKFIELELPTTTTTATPDNDGSIGVVPWPCLAFDSMAELQHVLTAKHVLTCPHMKHRMTVEFLQHLQAGGHEHDPVVFLFGDRTPGGRRLVLSAASSSSSSSAPPPPTSTPGSSVTSSSASSSSSSSSCQQQQPPSLHYRLLDYTDTIAAAVDHMRDEPCFVHALNATSCILSNMLAEEMLRQPLPGPGEHAPAA